MVLSQSLCVFFCFRCLFLRVFVWCCDGETLHQWDRHQELMGTCVDSILAAIPKPLQVPYGPPLSQCLCSLTAGRLFACEFLHQMVLSLCVCLSTHVLTEDVVFREVTSDNCLLSRRLLTKTNRLPRWAECIFPANLSRSVYVIEDSVIDLDNRRFTTLTWNVNHAKLMVKDNTHTHTQLLMFTLYEHIWRLWFNNAITLSKIMFGSGFWRLCVVCSVLWSAVCFSVIRTDLFGPGWQERLGSHQECLDSPDPSRWWTWLW